MTEPDLMEKALIDCFGKDLSNLTFLSVNSTLEALRRSYEDLEL